LVFSSFGATSRIHGKMCPVESAHFVRLYSKYPTNQRRPLARAERSA
jgi:hypothetical protein